MFYCNVMHAGYVPHVCHIDWRHPKPAHSNITVMLVDYAVGQAQPDQAGSTANNAHNKAPEHKHKFRWNMSACNTSQYTSTPELRRCDHHTSRYSPDIARL